MKLYKVTFEVELMVLAESENLAEEAVVTEDFDWSDEVRNGTAHAVEVTSIKQVAELDSLPWVTPDADEAIQEQTCRQILEEKEITE